MAVYLTEVVTDLAMPPQQRPIPHQFAMGDNNAYTITALLCDSRNPEAELLDGTVGGELVRPDGVTVALAGEKGDAVRQVNLAAGGLCNATPCSVTLPQACFAVPGRVTLTIKLTEGTTITQALSVSAVVVRTSTDEAVDPGEIIPDLAAIQAAAADALEAAADATEAAEAASTAMAGSVRFDQAQSLTDTQKSTARGNIAAASEEAIAPSDATTATSTHNPGDLLTMGGTLYKATQAIAPGTVITPGTNVSPTTVAAQLAERDTAIAAVSSAASAGVLAALDAQAAIDFGWIAGDQTSTGAGITAVRNGNRITLNGTVTSGLSSAQRFRMMGNLVTVNGSPTAAQNVSGAVLTNGHRYMTVMRLVSGTAVYSGDGTGFLTLAPYKSGSTSVYFNEVITSDDYTYYMRGGYADGSPLTLWVSFRSGWAFTNATYEVSVYDMTAKAWQSLPTTPTTDGTYTLKVTVTNGVPAYSWAAN